MLSQCYIWARFLQTTLRMVPRLPRSWLEIIWWWEQSKDSILPPHSAELQAGGDLGPQKMEFYNEMEGSSFRQELPPQTTSWWRTGGPEWSFGSCLWSAHLIKVVLNTNMASRRQVAVAAPPAGKLFLAMNVFLTPDLRARLREWEAHQHPSLSLNLFSLIRTEPDNFCFWVLSLKHKRDSHYWVRWCLCS